MLTPLLFKYASPRVDIFLGAAEPAPAILSKRDCMTCLVGRKARTSQAEP